MGWQTIQVYDVVLERHIETWMTLDPSKQICKGSWHPAVDANDDLIVKGWIVGNVTGPTLVALLDRLLSSWTDRLIEAAWDIPSFPPYIAPKILFYQPGDYARALLHEVAESGVQSD
jgi:hypothetical protein